MHQKIIRLPPQKKIYFVSDFHLGSPNHEASIEREQKIIRWMNQIKSDAYAIYFLGDIFDFWFEYKHVIPKGFIRFQGKIAELSDAGIAIFFLGGNHDMWMKDYFSTELGITTHNHPVQLAIGDYTLFLAHGDGLDDTEKGYRFLKKIYQHTYFKWLFSVAHPNWGISCAKWISKEKKKKYDERNQKKTKEKQTEHLINFCEKIEQTTHHDCYIFGHIHLPLDRAITAQSRYLNLGDWIEYNTYAVYDGLTVNLMHYTDS